MSSLLSDDAYARSLTCTKHDSQAMGYILTSSYSIASMSTQSFDIISLLGFSINIFPFRMVSFILAFSEGCIFHNCVVIVARYILQD